MEDKTAKDILEIVEFLKDNMVTRGEMKDEISLAKTEIMTHMDGFIGLHQKLDLELVALRAKYDRLESYIMKLAHHANVEL